MDTIHTLWRQAALALALWVPILLAAPPPLREQVSLNGVWDQGGKVPVYEGSVLDRQTYQRHVRVPASWTGRIIQLEFEGVNFVADIFVNQQFVARNVGGWKPFAVDVTRFAAPGESFELKMEVLGMKHAPILDENQRPLWPVGAFFLDNRCGGIVDDVWLRAYGKVHVENASVKTSWRRKEVEIEYAIRNRDDRTRTVRLQADVIAASGGPTVKRIDGPVITLAPGERRSVQVRSPWVDAELWWPDRPVLYHLETRLLEDDAAVDREMRRFGFREIWTEGNQYRLNGIRVNLWGEYATFGDPWFWPASAYTPQELPRTYAALRSLNERVLRWHRYPPPRYALELADETGLMIVAESPLYGRGYYRYNDREVFLRNIETWIESWIGHSRNHPSIVMWSAENEMIVPFQDLTRPEVARLREFIVRQDPTRPVVFHSDGRAEDGIINYHYPERFNHNPKGSVYSWARLVDPVHPTGIGEFLNPWTPKPGFAGVTNLNRWWQGIWMRGMRYVNIADFRPTIYQWSWKEMDSRRVANLRNAMAPVALFDKAYDDLGISPFTEDALPTLQAGAAVHRTLALYNDEFRDTAVTVEVQLRSGNTIHASASRTYQVPLGEHVDIPCSFQAPPVTTGSVEFVLATRKAGIRKFEEVKVFRIARGTLQPSNSHAVVLGDPLPPTHTPPSRVRAQAGERAVTLNWDPAPGAVRYIVKRSKMAAGPYATVFQPKMPAFADTGLESGTEYHYMISAINGSLSPNGEVESGNSAAITISMAGPPTTPAISITSPRAGENITGGIKTNILWSSNGNPGPLIIEFSHDGGAFWNTLAVTTQDGGESVTLPAIAADKCRIRLRQKDGPAQASTGDFRLGLAGQVAGELKTWHPVTITFDGPLTSETAEPNPFRSFRLNVTFSKGEKRYTVPGYYAADGRAAEFSSTSGTKWRVHFVPDEEGQWTYHASFRSGVDIAISMDPGDGAAAAFDGAQGSFMVNASDKSGRDHRGKGSLRYTGRHYLQFAGTKEYFIKGGSDSPETFLGYYGFDDTPGKHKYEPHAKDWHGDDPSWQYDRGRNIIGALNYLSDKGVNSLYFLTLNVHPDRPNTIWPWIRSDVRDRFDCSKLDQWEIVFAHMDRLGILLHVVLQERQNDQMLDNGDLGPLRKLYHRELIARFAHHLALTWNLGEENGAVSARVSSDIARNPKLIVPQHTHEELDAFRKKHAQHIAKLDPYGHPIVVHTYPNQKELVYEPLLGFPYVEGASLQHPKRADIKKWLERSEAAGRPWIVTLDESGDSDPAPPGPRDSSKGSVGVAPDWISPDHDIARKRDLWGTLMAGGAGVEWYFGWQYPENDGTCEDFRSRDRMWDMTRYALEFFQRYLPFAEMRPADELVAGNGAYSFAKRGEIYAVYFPEGGTATLDLAGAPGVFTVEWYNPRKGGGLQSGSVRMLHGPGVQSLGEPPAEVSKDWAVLVRRERRP